MIKLIFSFLLIVIFSWILLAIVIRSFINGIGPMPSSAKAVKCLIKLIPNDLEGTVYEMGSGWGTLAFPAARKLKNCQFIGYENSFFPYFFSKIRLFFFPLPNLKIYWKNFYDMPLNDASLVICYLFPGAMTKLKDKFQNELKPHTLVISNTFAISSWTPIKIEKIRDVYNTNIYVYEI